VVWGADPDKRELLVCSSNNVWVFRRSYPGGVSVHCDGDQASQSANIRCLDPHGVEVTASGFSSRAGASCLPCMIDCSKRLCSDCQGCNDLGFDAEKHQLLSCGDDYRWQVKAECPGGFSVDCNSSNQKTTCLDADGNPVAW
jgi:hypothetical protein